MTLLHVVSDLHVEWGGIDLPDVAADVGILAGDTYPVRDVGWPHMQPPPGKPWLAVAGNHEFWGGKIDTALGKIRPQAAARGITLLENEAVVIAGTRFLGCTLWSDFRLFAGDDIMRAKADAAHCVGDRYSTRVMDYWRIRVAADNYRKLRPLDTIKLHEASVRWLDETLATPFDGPSVVITHHAPSALCVPDALMMIRTTCADVSNLDWLIEKHQPDLWVWGHIHEAVEPFSIGRTRMVSNPRGYYPNSLEARFNPAMTLSLQA